MSGTGGDETDSVLAALLTALESNSTDAALLLHIAQHLQGKARYEEALGYFQQVLAHHPTHQEALTGAQLCAAEAGDSTKAQAYQTLLDSLAPEAAQTPAPEAPKSGGALQSVEPGDSPAPERVRGAKLRLVTEGGKLDDWVDTEDSNIYLDDVGGMEDVKRRLHLSFLAPLKNPELMEAYGKNLSGGLLLYGPPGCGKTFIARALAGELGAKFVAIGLTDILDMYVGESERRLHEIFETARRNAPTVLFFDELDAIGQKRNQLRNSGMRSLVNQLLAEMDSINSVNDNLFVLGATNHPWDIDSALRRPGRFDRIVPVFPPDLSARASILSYHLENKPVSDVDIEGLAAATEHFSGADLRYLCDTAAEYAIEAAMQSGEVHPLSTDDFKRPLGEIKPSTRSWFETARNFAMFANESGSYDDLLEYIREHNL